MNTITKHRTVDSASLRYISCLWVLSLSAFFLVGRLIYCYLSDAERFPVATIKIVANYEHVTRKELEEVLRKYTNKSFFTVTVRALQNELSTLNGVDSAMVQRIWPDTLKIKLIEKKPVAIWEKSLMAADGTLFNGGRISKDLHLPRLKGPASQQVEVLQVYEKLSKILSLYNLRLDALYLRENRSWLLLLSNGIKIYLGKTELEARLLRFCKAYPAVFAEKIGQLASVDLRYPRGMAVLWKQQMRR